MHLQAVRGGLPQQRAAPRLAGLRGRRRSPAAQAVRAYQGPPYAQPGAAAAADSDVSDIVSYAKRRLHSDKAQAAQPGPMGDFFRKLGLAWRIFFPEQPRTMTPKEEGKQRLRMILVADRVGMNEVTMEAMRERIIGAVSPYVEIESPDLVEVAVTTDVELGAIYSVAVPVRRVKPAARIPLNADGEFEFVWDPTDEDADPASQFPYGT